MTESPIVNEWMQQVGNERELRALRGALLTFLEGRFPGAVPPEVIETINSQPGATLLTEWITQAARVPTIEAFRTYLRR